MSVYNKFNSFIEALAEKTHDLGTDQLTVFLTNNAPIASNSVIADITEIAYTNCSTRDLTVSSSAQTGGTYKLVIDDLTLTASGGNVGPFRYVGIYNSTTLNGELIGWYDYGSSFTLGDAESIKLDFDGTNGVFTLA